MAQLVYPELSYQLIGAAFKVYNTLGYGLHEKYYHRGYIEELNSLKLSFKHEYYIDLIYNGKKIGNCFLDFIIDDKIIIEFKVQPVMNKLPIKQVYGYLRATGLELAIVIYITRDGIKYRRILNPDFKKKQFGHYLDKIRT